MASAPGGPRIEDSELRSRTTHVNRKYRQRADLRQHLGRRPRLRAAQRICDGGLVRMAGGALAEPETRRAIRHLSRRVHDPDESQRVCAGRKNDDRFLVGIGEPRSRRSVCRMTARLHRLKGFGLKAQRTGGDRGDAARNIRRPRRRSGRETSGSGPGSTSLRPRGERHRSHRAGRRPLRLRPGRHFWRAGWRPEGVCGRRGCPRDRDQLGNARRHVRIARPAAMSPTISAASARSSPPRRSSSSARRSRRWRRTCRFSSSARLVAGFGVGVAAVAAPALCGRTRPGCAAGPIRLVLSARDHHRHLRRLSRR